MNIKIKSTNSLKWGKSDVEKEKCSHLKNLKFHTAIPSWRRCMLKPQVHMHKFEDEVCDEWQQA